MNFRRQQTRVQTEHPVRFYKIVALTFLVITVILFGVIVFMSSKRTTVTISTKAELMEVTGSVAVNGENELASISGQVTTSTLQFSQLFQPTGTRQEDGLAVGTITIHNETSADQPLVATTRFLTEDGVLFRLKDRITSPANGTIEAEVYADQEGVAGNIGPSRFTIPGLSSAKQEVIYGVSDAAMTGGVRTIGILTEVDIDSAKQVMRDQFLESGKSYVAKNFPDMKSVLALDNIDITSDTEARKEVSGFTLTGTALLTAVLVDAAELKNYAEQLLETRAVDDVSTLQPSDVPPAVSLVEYNASDNTAVLEIVYTGIAALNPESKQLDKMMLYGKTKDEVRRYLLSLSHVYGVDIEFRPAWMRTVPHVADHVKIIVKNIE
jgi:hypothetical protein